MIFMSWMIVELDTSDSAIYDKNSKVFTNQSMLLPEPAAIKDVIRWCQAAEWDRAYVFHESIGASRNLLTSIRYMCCLRKTRSPFPCDGRYMRYCGWSMDLVARAIYRDPVVTDFL